MHDAVHPTPPFASGGDQCYNRRQTSIQHGLAVAARLRSAAYAAQRPRGPVKSRRRTTADRPSPRLVPPYQPSGCPLAALWLSLHGPPASTRHLRVKPVLRNEAGASGITIRPPSPHPRHLLQTNAKHRRRSPDGSGHRNQPVPLKQTAKGHRPAARRQPGQQQTEASTNRTAPPSAAAATCPSIRPIGQDTPHNTAVPSGSNVPE